MTTIFDLPPDFDVVDLFAGPGGWDVAAHRLGLTVVGIEWDQAACDTRRAAGLPTLQGDVRAFGPGTDWFRHLVIRARGFIASPPCQTFSMAGSGSGRKDLALCIEAVELLGEAYITGQGVYDQQFNDDRTSLVIEPLRWILEAATMEGGGWAFDWIALEQVPAVLPIWEAYAKVLGRFGYSVDTGILYSEQYGVPQTRKRAVLVAKQEGVATLPTPTHSKYHSRTPDRLDEGVAKWVTMSEALGWGLRQRPSYTVCAGGARTGGAEPFTKQPREAMIAASADPERWVQRSNYSGPPRPGKVTAAERGRGERSMDAPSFAITTKTFQFTSPSAMVRPSIADVARLQTFPADHPFQGNRGKQHEQVGNAVPPMLAEHILRSVK